MESDGRDVFLDKMAFERHLMEVRQQAIQVS